MPPSYFLKGNLDCPERNVRPTTKITPARSQQGKREEYALSTVINYWVFQQHKVAVETSLTLQYFRRGDNKSTPTVVGLWTSYLRQYNDPHLTLYTASVPAFLTFTTSAGCQPLINSTSPQPDPPRTRRRFASTPSPTLNDTPLAPPDAPRVVAACFAKATQA